jgi:proteasome lid subunit RPN8/RPN11
MTAAVETMVRLHAVETYPYECCGALIGIAGAPDGVSIGEALPLTNVTSEGPRRRFLVSPDDYRQAEAHAAAARAELVGFYHSHPDHPAEPSQYDLDHAWPNLSYVIVSVTDGRACAMRSWRLRADRSRFEEEPITSFANNG